MARYRSGAMGNDTISLIKYRTGLSLLDECQFPFDPAVHTGIGAMSSKEFSVSHAACDDDVPRDTAIPARQIIRNSFCALSGKPEIVVRITCRIGVADKVKGHDARGSAFLLQRTTKGCQLLIGCWQQTA